VKKRQAAISTGRRGDKSSIRPVSSLGTSQIITLLTDFGARDYFVGAMKGAILAINPDARIIDISHDIPPQDVEAAAFNLLALRNTFPRGTINLGVVDPGVGSSRRPILMILDGQYYVGPDNGIFSYVADAAGELLEIYELKDEKFFRQPVSATFNGRDIFAPVAAALSTGVKAAQLGPKSIDYVRLPSLEPRVTRRELKGRIIHIDHFGNCITNITPKELSSEIVAGGPELLVGRRVVRQFRQFFSETSRGADKVFMIWGSAGFLELAVENDSAARVLKVKRSQPVTIRFR
jgi:S-adenosylmethionine hydrolase